MYGVVAGQNEPCKSKQCREQNVEERENNKKRSFTNKLFTYIQKRFNPQPEDEVSESSLASSSRHRPEALSALAQNTRFTPHEIKLMYRGFKQECPSGVVDEEAFKHIFSQFFPLGDASQYAHFVFNSIKHKQTGKINFEEFLEILSRVARGSTQEKLAWVFALYDVDGDGLISHHEMTRVVQAIYSLVGTSCSPPVERGAAAAHAARVLAAMGAGAGGASRDQLARWCTRDAARARSLAALDTVL